MKPPPKLAKTITVQIFIYFCMAVGAFLAAFSLEVFLIPSNLIDGGIIGIAMICGYIFGHHLLPYFLMLFTLPFLVMAFRFIGKSFLLHMLFSVAVFVGSIFFIQHVMPWKFVGDSLEVVVIGGSILGIGTGLIIRYGGCLDGTEIFGIILNRKIGFSVGQVVLFCNIFIFAAAGVVFQDWHPPLLSLITFMVATKVMDSVIVGLEETKSVLIISSKSKEISDAIIHELGLGLTIMYGRGGYSGEQREIIYVIAERLQLAELKDLIHREDPSAFIAIENLHEVSSGLQVDMQSKRRKRIDSIISRILRTS